ncbi:MAG: acylphosphatase [Nitrospirales bacterium]
MMTADVQDSGEGLSELYPIVRAHLLVSGRVQGVAFRAFTQREARRLNLSGWVRNLQDGRVESEVEGRQEEVDAFLVALNQGPALASVEHVQVSWKKVLSESSEFRILR